MLPTHLPHYPAPAKLNLDLRITGRRADGYHELESIFVLTNLSDSLAITPRRDSRITLHTPAPNVPPEQDLCTRAARALQQFSGCRFGADIWLEKHIPMGGGLGGGSSDAATVLRVLNHLWHLELDCPTLIRIGATLGADIPFFIFGESAFARGIGDRLQAVSIPPQSFVIVRPTLHIPTAAVFAHPALPRNSPPAANPSYESLQPFRNDMQSVVLQNHPEAAAAYRALAPFGDARLTGSGSCLFLSCPTTDEAHSIRARLPSNLQSWTAELLPRHPLTEIIPF